MRKIRYAALLFTAAFIVPVTLGFITGDPRGGIITGLGVGIAFTILSLVRPLGGAEKPESP